MSNPIEFLKSRTFFLHLLLSSVVALLLVVGVYFWLDRFTKHGETVLVPELRNIPFSRIESQLEGTMFNYEIADSSVFLLDKLPGTIIDQDPAPGQSVKVGRTIYVTVTRKLPPQVKIPHLTDVSKRQAEAILMSYGLRSGDVIYEPDVAKDVVLGLRYKGRELRVGDEVPKGSSIDLVLGDGKGNTETGIPVLIGLTLDEARFVLDASGLMAGEIDFDETVRDTNLARVFKQDPMPGDSVILLQGETVGLFLTQNKDKIKK
jgi:beta-lactam-binding protein with PASTA domain